MFCLMALSTSEANAQAVGGEPYRFTSKQGWCLDGQYSSWVVRNVCSAGGLETTWSKYVVGQGYFKLVSKYTGKCAEVASHLPGERVRQSPCVWGAPTGLDKQRWRALYVRTANGIPYYIIENESGHCLAHVTVTWWGGGLNDPFTTQQLCTASDNQLWDSYNMQYQYHGS